MSKGQQVENLVKALLNGLPNGVAIGLTPTLLLSKDNNGAYSVKSGQRMHRDMLARETAELLLESLASK